MLASSARVRYEPLRSISAVDITTDYVGVGLPLANPSRIFKVTNLTDAAIFVSIDGITDYDVVAANAAYVYDFGTNRTSAGGLFEQPQGDRIYMKAVVSLPTLGSAYITTIYASQV